MSSLGEGAAESRLRVVRPEGFEPASAVGTAERDEFLRRFSTLLVDDATAREGGLGRVVRAQNASGESFAVKVLSDSTAADGNADGLGSSARDASSTNDDGEGPRLWQQAAFDEEYAAHQALSGLRGFPRLYGRCQVDGRPAMVMEWIEGVTLTEAARQLAVDDAGRLSPLTAARLGRDLFELLTYMALTADGFSHRDISPANVMVDTSRMTVAQQVEEGAFELRLIDFGSAAAGLDERKRSLTAVYGAPRGATADFAAPELLTADVAAASAYRKAPAVDVYAAAGVLFWLLCGQAPFNLSQRDAGGELLSPYRVKTESSPRASHFAHQAQGAALSLALAREPEVSGVVSRYLAEAESAPSQGQIAGALQTVDATLKPLLEACLRADPQQRPSARDAYESLAQFCRQYDRNVEAALGGRPVSGCADRVITAAPEQVPSKAAAAVHWALVAVASVAWASVAVSGAILLGGAPVTVEAGPLTWSGAVPAAAWAALLALPGALGLLLRGRSASSRGGLARGTVGALAGLGIVLVLAACAQVSAAVQQLFAPALAAATLAPWALLVVGYAFGEKAPIGGGRPSLPEDAAASAALPASQPDSPVAPSPPRPDAATAISAPNQEVSQ